MTLLKRSVLIFFSLILFAALQGQTGPGDDHESRDLREYQELAGGKNRTKYQINARIIPERREVTGVEIIRWTNRSASRISSLKFNLFYNAFENPDSTFFSETSFFRLPEKELKQYNFGGIQVDKIEIINRNESSSAELAYLSPDDGNRSDRTAAEFNLKDPVLPGQTIWIKTEFTLKIPDIFFKTGQEGNYIFLAHWYPKLSVLQNNGEWAIHQFHRMRGFFSEFSDYHVRITMPEKFRVGATGRKVSEEKLNDAYKVHEFKQDNVQGFALSAYPHFIEVRDRIKLKGNEFDTEIILLLSHRNSSARERYLNVTKFTLKYFEEHLGSYPYRTITIVDPPLPGFNSAGHEYPTLITAAYLKILPASINYTELAVIHGISHQFWSVAAASDGFKEPWLDEGFAVFYEMDIMEKYFEKSGSLFHTFYMRISDWEIKRRSYINLSPLEGSRYLSWNIFNNKFFLGNVYSKVSLLLRTLKNVLGEGKFEEFLRYYFEKIKFGHHDTGLFKNALNEYFNGDFSWAVDQFFGTDSNLDTAVHSVRAEKIGDSGRFRNEAVFVRKSGFFPVELSVKLKGGKEIKIYWEKNEKWKKVVFTDEQPIEFAFVDPEFKIPMDVNLVNNSKTVRKEGGFFRNLAVKFGFYFQNILATLIL